MVRALTSASSSASSSSWFTGRASGGSICIASLIFLSLEFREEEEMGTKGFEGLGEDEGEEESMGEAAKNWSRKLTRDLVCVDYWGALSLFMG